jgi:bloom syndrome protein
LNQAEDSCRDDPVKEASHNSIDPDLFEGIFSADEEEDEPVPYELGDDDPDILDQTDHSLLHAPSGSIDIIRPITSKTSTNPSHKSNATQNAASITHVPPPEEDLSKKMNHPWSRDVGKALVHVFKLRSWRHNQIDAINTTLSGKDCFVLMPTGGGKCERLNPLTLIRRSSSPNSLTHGAHLLSSLFIALCYQLPAVVRSGVTKGVTIVISPLISLITDQVQALCAKHIGAAAFTGTMTSVERDYVTNDLRSVDPALCLVYVTPEMVRLQRLHPPHVNTNINGYVINPHHNVLFKLNFSL